MKRKAARQIAAETLDAYLVRQRPVSVRTLTIDFQARTIDFDGRHIKVETDRFAIPILDGSAAFVSRGDMERVL
jgi:hypothetical protein